MQDIPIKDQFILDLHTVGAIKFGEFKLKSGQISPYYLDLRLLVSYPYLLESVASVFWEKLRLLNFDVIVGVPYTAIPIATTISLQHNQNMVFVRKEQKSYGTKKLIEGVFHSGQKAIIIDDVITDGASKLETIQHLKEAGLVADEVVVLFDRGQGGPEHLKKQGIKCQAIFDIYEVFEVLIKYRRVSKTVINKSIEHIKKNTII